jgi:ABC-2 type transport system permease protein
VPTIFYAITVAVVGSPDLGPVIGGYLGAILLGAAYSSVGIFASTLSKNQIIAFIIGLIICGTLWMIDKFLFFLHSSIVGFFEYLGADYHFRNISRGVIDTRDIIYFLSVIAISIIGSVQVLEEGR